MPIAMLRLLVEIMVVPTQACQDFILGRLIQCRMLAKVNYGSKPFRDAMFIIQVPTILKHPRNHSGIPLRYSKRLPILVRYRRVCAEAKIGLKTSYCPPLPILERRCA